MDIFFAFLGLVILVLGGDSLVRGSVNLSLRLGIPALIVSLTIVAVGTSAPELLIAIKAVLENAPGLAIGNVIGSNTANILLVLGLPAMISGLNTSQCDTRQSYAQMLFATALFAVFAFFQPFTWAQGLILVGLFSAIMVQAIFAARLHRSAAALATAALPEVEHADLHMPWWRIAMYVVLGLIALPLGAGLLVDSATSIARSYSVSETVIGLTLVAIGTSLPELATTVSAALRREAGIAIGNVIGSNLANLLAIIGIATFFGDIPVSSHVLDFDLWVMIASSLLLFPFVIGNRNITRLWGAVFMALYVAYIIDVLVYPGSP